MNEARNTMNLVAVAAFMVANGVDSTAELARLTGIERTYLSRILRGQRPAQPSQIIAIANALSVPRAAIAVLEQAANAA